MAGTLIFDGDCGFCTTSAGFAQRYLGGRVATVPWQFAPLGTFGLTEAECTEAVQFVDTAGRRYAGAAAVAAALRSGRAVWRPLGVLLAAPGVRSVAEAAYRWVARHRYQLPGGTPACRIG